MAGGIRDFKLSITGVDVTRVTNAWRMGGKNFECFQEFVLCRGWITYDTCDGISFFTKLAGEYLTSSTKMKK